MKRVLLTGMSGTGKSSVITELAARGYKAVDADYDGFSELVEIPPGSDPHEPGLREDWVWSEDRVARLLATEDADVLFFSGAASNMGKFRRQFDHVVLLSAPIDVMTERLLTRTNNPYGKSPGELDRVTALKKTVEPLLRRIADVEIDTSIPLDQVVAKILEEVGV
jgi:dephospho-CoA kinase